MKYKGIRVGGHAARIVGLTGAGVKLAQAMSDAEEGERGRSKAGVMPPSSRTRGSLGDLDVLWLP